MMPAGRQERRQCGALGPIGILAMLSSMLPCFQIDGQHQEKAPREGTAAAAAGSDELHHEAPKDSFRSDDKFGWSQGA